MSPFGGLYGWDLGLYIYIYILISILISLRFAYFCRDIHCYDEIESYFMHFVYVRGWNFVIIRDWALSHHVPSCSLVHQESMMDSVASPIQVFKHVSSLPVHPLCSRYEFGKGSFYHCMHINPFQHVARENFSNCCQRTVNGSALV